MKETIQAPDFKRMVLSAAAAIQNNRQTLNEMNVFPVPDGDTGVNMSLTMKSAATALQASEPETVGSAAELTASSLLRGARGNSGVILSLLFRGIAKSCTGLETLDAVQFAAALGAGVEAAYRAVMKPAEGTILTVSRKAAERAIEAARDERDILAVLEKAMAAADAALEETTELNPVLKKAGVVDAGGKGWTIALEAMFEALSGRDILPLEQEPAGEAAPAEGAVFSQETGEITFAYCTEYIVNRSAQGKRKDAARLRALLESIGDCVVVVDDEEIVKVHVHTNNPDKALGEALKYGELVNIKIENMREQHTQKVIQEQKRAQENTPAEPEKTYGFVAVGAGEGIRSVYEDLGIDYLVEGGQTMNPSTQDILAAVDATPAEIVFVFPNNKNIVMAAQQTVDLTKKQVVVIPTTSMPQGISAMLAFNPDLSVEENVTAMQAAADAVNTGSITYAARDSEFDGHAIREGEYLALSENKLSSNGADLIEVARTLAGDMHMEEKGFITVFYGQGATADQAAQVEAVYKEAAPHAEVMVLDGGQPVYYYIISAE